MSTSTDSRVRTRSDVRGEHRSRESESQHERPAILQRSVMQNRSSVRSNYRHRIAQSPQQVFAAPAPPPSTTPPQAPHGGHNPFDQAGGSGPSWLVSRNVLPPFAEQPRPAPAPPNRPSRFKLGAGVAPEDGQDNSQVDGRLDRIQGQDNAGLHTVLPLRPHTAKSSTGHHTPSKKSDVPLVRSSTAPPTFAREHSAAIVSTVGVSSADTHQPGISSGSGRGRRSFDEYAAQRNNGPVSGNSSRSKSRSDAVGKPSGSRSPGSFHAQSKRKRKGETMSMLVDTGFFPVEELIYGKSSEASQLRQSHMYRIDLPPRLSFVEKDLPPTPATTTMRTSPTELYTGSPTSPLSPKTQNAGNRRSGMIGRSPLSQISENRAAIEIQEELHGQSELASIGEDTADEENVPPKVDSAAPTATQIHLRGGSVVTVTPLEMSAWRIAVYLHGPIKLPKPVIVPRKNSVASLEPFQDVVDQLYQHSLMIPRRRSDDAVVDELCDFFDDFGFDNTSFDGDRFGASIEDFDETLELEKEAERFSTPPLEASPIEVVVAKEVLDSISKLQSPYAYPMLPVETEETLRARGIARLSRASAGSAASVGPSSRKESLTLGKGERTSQGLLLPPLDGSNCGSPRSGSIINRSISLKKSSGISGSQGNMRANDGDGVQEISGSSVWVAPAAAPRRSSVSKGSSSRKSRRNPIDKLRRAVASASTNLLSMDI
ncbi:hypothetical protein Slin15195_G002920 [Septoria linicola]|uniref:Uncharacterized protein n=1 Tax=Septoria linicola TaxID=215465 RepID=A0A9Q9AHH5_9PEZI|nr:hypothetical protein Slin14017_G002940 [Septoria linicola]USW46973.1 hypothetical protein Slin15195_G002920 [Septoria linicola]